MPATQTIAMRLPNARNYRLTTCRAPDQRRMVAVIGKAIRAFAMAKGVAPLAVDWHMV